MAFSARRLRHTYADYLAVERDTPVRHEFCDGEIYAMAGGTPQHGILAAELIALLRRQLPADCLVMTSDVRLRVEATDLTTYPDVSVVCGQLSMSPIDPYAITNPVLLVEVTSPSSEDYDRGEKLSQYKQLAGVRSVLIVSHRAPRVTLVERDGSTWRLTEARGGERVVCGAPPIAFEVGELYTRVRL
jgi:Uma2 family endonuclease